MATKTRTDLTSLLNQARQVQMSLADKEAQRRSFAFGNANIENSRVTRETVKRQAELLESSADGE